MVNKIINDNLEQLLKNMLADIEIQKEKIINNIEKKLENKMAPDSPKIYVGLMDKEGFYDTLFPSIDMKTFTRENLIDAIENKNYLSLNNLSEQNFYCENDKKFSLSFYINEPYSLSLIHI